MSLNSIKNCTSNASKLQRCMSTLPELPPCNFSPKKYQGPTLEQLKKTRSSKLNPALTTYYKSPIAFHQGHKQWLFDINGRRYLDMFGGICTVSVGHCHPKINEAVREQSEILGHVSNIYYNSKIHEYAEKLTDTFPGDLKVAYFVNSGSEANDLAMLMARVYTKNYDVVSLRNSYHGMSCQTMGITANSGYKYAVPQSAGILHTMNPDVYKGIWGGAHCRDSPIQTDRSCECGVTGKCLATEKYLQQFEELFAYSLPRGKLAAFYAESIQGVGGSVQFPRGYLKGAYDLVKKNGGVFISDEVQTGFGRTGEHFWGFQMHGIQPDIVTMAKGIGNGYPLAAVVTTTEVANALASASHFNTYGGNPIASTVGMAVLDIIEEEKLQENSKLVGTHLLKELAKLQSEFEMVGDVRGKGLMIGVEFVESKDGKNPLDSEKFMKMWEKTLSMGLVIGKGGLNGNVLRIKPPMCITKDDADFTVEVLRESIKHIL